MGDKGAWVANEEGVVERGVADDVASADQRTKGCTGVARPRRVRGMRA